MPTKRKEPRRTEATEAEAEKICSSIRGHSDEALIASLNKQEWVCPDIKTVAKEMNLTIPAVRDALLRGLDEAMRRDIRQEFVDGSSVRSIAEYWNLTIKQVWGVLTENHKKASKGGMKK